MKRDVVIYDLLSTQREWTMVVACDRMGVKDSVVSCKICQVR